jgi:hypothetical protein
VASCCCCCACPLLAPASQRARQLPAAAAAAVFDTVSRSEAGLLLSAACCGWPCLLFCLRRGLLLRLWLLVGGAVSLHTTAVSGGDDADPLMPALGLSALPASFKASGPSRLLTSSSAAAAHSCTTAAAVAALPWLLGSAKPLLAVGTDTSAVPSSLMHIRTAMHAPSLLLGLQLPPPLLKAPLLIPNLSVSTSLADVLGVLLQLASSNMGDSSPTCALVASTDGTTGCTCRCCCCCCTAAVP